MSSRSLTRTLSHFFLNIEIRVSEQLGLLTVREDYDSLDDGSIADFRLLSKQFGIDIETHIIKFAKCYSSFPLLNGAPCGIVAVGSVDEDELYLYRSCERVRKDVSEIVVLAPRIRPKVDGDGGGLIVVMACTKFLWLHKPALDVPARIMHAMRESMCWGPVIVSTLNQLLHPEFVAPPCWFRPSAVMLRCSRSLSVIGCQACTSVTGFEQPTVMIERSNQARRMDFPTHEYSDLPSHCLRLDGVPVLESFKPGLAVRITIHCDMRSTHAGRPSGSSANVEHLIAATGSSRACLAIQGTRRLLIRFANAHLERKLDVERANFDHEGRGSGSDSFSSAAHAVAIIRTASAVVCAFTK